MNPFKWIVPSRGTSQTSPPLPEPDLASRDRARNAGRLVEVAGVLELVADVAAGKVIRPDMDEHRAPVWLLGLAAPAHDEQPSDALVRWLALFSEELDAVWRARNNIRWGQWISDGNVAAAAQMAERLLRLAEAAGSMSA